MTAKLITAAGTVELTGSAARLAEVLALYHAEIARVRFGYVRFNFGAGAKVTAEVNQSLRID